MVLIFQTITKLVNFDVKYKQIFQEAGLLHMLINLLKQFHTQFLGEANTESDEDPSVAATSVTTTDTGDGDDSTKTQGASTAMAIPRRPKHSRVISISSMLDLDENLSLPSPPHSRTHVPRQAPTPGAPEEDEPPILTSYTVTTDCITVLLDNVPENARIFRESGCVQILFALVCNKETRYCNLASRSLSLSLSLSLVPLTMVTNQHELKIIHTVMTDRQHCECCLYCCNKTPFTCRRTWSA